MKISQHLQKNTCVGVSSWKRCRPCHFIKKRLYTGFFQWTCEYFKIIFLSIYLSIQLSLSIYIFTFHTVNFPKLCGRCTFPQNFHLKKLGKSRYFRQSLHLSSTSTLCTALSYFRTLLYSIVWPNFSQQFCYTYFRFGVLFSLQNQT